MGFVKIIVVDNLSEVTINYEAEKALKPSVNPISDDWRGYRGLTKVVGGLKQRVTIIRESGKSTMGTTVISNAKRLLHVFTIQFQKNTYKNYFNEILLENKP
ncbi:MAG: hypothetical protein IPH98_18075 [Saprospiraceae bacterium]|nr:hypothetical protein [Candidatus Defluviibacterium haderslevense]